MQHTGTGVVFVSTLEVEARVDAHVTGWYEDILVVRNVYTCRVVHLVIGSRSYGERRYGTFAMIEYGIDVWWENALIGIVYIHCRVSPPQEGLRHIGSVIETALDFQIGTAGT